MRTLDSTAADHSILSQDYQWLELLSATVLTMFGSEDGERILQLNNSSSTAHLRPSDPSNGRTTLWKSNLTVDQPTSE
jgi:hypothetical protein